MTKSNSPAVLDDQFEEDSYLKIDQYTKEHDQLNIRIQKLEDRFGSHEQIASTLLETAKTQLHLKTMIQSTLVDLIQKDDDVKQEVKKTVDKLDRDEVSVLLKRLGFAGWSVVVFIAGIVATTLIQNLFQKLN